MTNVIKDNHVWKIMMKVVVGLNSKSNPLIDSIHL
jgi:hypothetical protein